MTETIHSYLLAVPPYAWALVLLAGVTLVLIGGFALVERRRPATDLEPIHVPRHSMEGETRDMRREVRAPVWPEDLRP